MLQGDKNESVDNFFRPYPTINIHRKKKRVTKNQIVNNSVEPRDGRDREAHI
jgi:hypothetical protein